MRGKTYPLRIPQDTEVPLEQMALEAWEMARRGLAGEEPFFEEIDPQELQKELMGEKTEEKEDDMMSLTLQEAMQKFYDYVKDRIENGDPEFPIGGASMSIREWEKMSEKKEKSDRPLLFRFRQTLETTAAVSVTAAEEKQQDNPTTAVTSAVIR